MWWSNDLPAFAPARIQVSVLRLARFRLLRDIALVDRQRLQPRLFPQFARSLLQPGRLRLLCPRFHPPDLSKLRCLLLEPRCFRPQLLDLLARC